MKLLSVIIPCFNEENTIDHVLEKILDVNLLDSVELEIIVVNDCSTDDSDHRITKFIKTRPQATIHYLKHTQNKGKGAAIRTGFAHASGDYCIIQDADLEYDPHEYNLLLKPALYRNADAVFGSRFIGGQPHRILFFWHSIGNKFLTFLSNMLSNLNLTDMECCYKLIRTNILKTMILRENRFGFEPEITARLAQLPNIKIYEVGISYHGRTYAEGKKIGWRDGFRALYCIVRYNLF